MKKSILKTISILALVIMIAFVFVTPTFATVTGGSYDDISFDAKDDSGASDSVTNIIGAIIRIVQIIGIGVAIIMLTVLAIKYIAASPNDKAEIKKHIVVYVVGAIILFSAAGILEIIRKFATSNIKASSTTPTPDKGDE